MRFPFHGRNSNQFAVDQTDESSYSLKLPAIRDNNGKEGAFLVHEPDDGQVGVSGRGLIANKPISSLGAGFNRSPAGRTRSCTSRPADDPPGIEAISSGQRAADRARFQYFFTSFEENGSVLCVMVMDLPPEIGPRVSIKPVPEAAIWSLKVNGKIRKIYDNQGDAWLIPLAAGELSHVELAMLLKGRSLVCTAGLKRHCPKPAWPRAISVSASLCLSACN